MQHTPRHIAAVLLAAGGSTRMAPRHKLLLEIRGEPMVRVVARTALAAGLAPVVAVTGHRGRAVRAALAGLPLTCIANRHWRTGIAGSIRAGLTALPAECDGALLVLADMPLVSTAQLQRLCAAFAPQRGASLCLPTHGGRYGNPVLWGRAHFPALRELTGDRGARSLFEANRRHRIEVAMDDDGVLLDVDTPAALAAVRARIEISP
ncbi:MAG: nucleotidyltransferase family protein [Gammaproteobacteria bacterium]|nr:nucleotidyltransferase family protein [Gammaproteobacteria bacterium]